MAMVTITPSGRFLSIPSRLSIYSTRISFSSLNAIHFQTGRTALPIRAGNNGPGSSGTGDEESKAILNAFFLGKAFAEVVNERVGTALGEFLSDVGRKQAEQQRQVREFQEEVQRRAQEALVKAAREAFIERKHSSASSITVRSSQTLNANGLDSSDEPVKLDE